MNVEIGAEAALFPEKKYISRVFVAVRVQEWIAPQKFPELEFLKRLWGLGTEEEKGYRTGPPGYIGWRNSFIGIDYGAPYTFKNTSSGFKESDTVDRDRG